MPKPPGYHYAEGHEGQLAIQMDEPCAKYARISWVPKEAYLGKQFDAVIPRSLLDHVMVSYVKEIAGVERHAAAAEKVIARR